MNEAKSIVAQIVEWTKLKCRIQVTGAREPYFKEREIWWASIGANVGSEQNGKNELYERPVLVLKKFSPSLLWMLPLTTTDHTGEYYFPTRHEEEQRMQNVVLSQIRTISAKRLVRKQRTLPAEEFAAIREKLKNLL